MLKSELMQNGNWIRHYSDDPNMGVLQKDTGLIYDEAVDIYPTEHTYEEVPLGRSRVRHDLEERVTRLEEEMVEVKGAM